MSRLDKGERLIILFLIFNFIKYFYIIFFLDYFIKIIHLFFHWS